MNDNQKRIRVFVAEYLQTLPSDQVVWKTMSGDLTSQDMIKSLQANEESALIWLSELLRVWRDVLARRSLKFDTPLEMIELDVSQVDLAPFQSLLKEMTTTDVIFKQDGIAYNKEQLQADDTLVAQWGSSILKLALGAFAR